MLLLSLFLMGADGGGQGRDELDALRSQQKSLRHRIENLRREQDYLLFQKAMLTADSKYLILNVTKNTGKLMYKNRVLKDFHFVRSKNFSGAALKPGMVVLTKKAGGEKSRPALIFGTSLVLQGKRPKVEGAKLPFISVTKREMRSIFFAVEEGALAYIVR